MLDDYIKMWRLDFKKKLQSGERFYVRERSNDSREKTGVKSIHLPRWETSTKITTES